MIKFNASISIRIDFFESNIFNIDFFTHVYLNYVNVVSFIFFHDYNIFFLIKFVNEIVLFKYFLTKFFIVINKFKKKLHFFDVN